MNVLDLFSGIGGFSLGLERAGMRTVAFCEIDPYCRAVLRKHWPTVPIFEDVRKLTASDVGPIDVICGGFPCQDISLAGKGAGIDGERSGLWREYARLIGEIHPRYVIVENVAALLGRGLERVLGDLAALGFDAEWHCIPASAVGAPHRRDRVWIIAYANRDGQYDGAVDAEVASASESISYSSSEGRRQELREAYGDEGAHAGWAEKDMHIAGRDGTQRKMAYASSLGLEGFWLSSRIREEITSASCASWWQSEPDVGRVAHGVPARMDRLRALGNAVVPQIPEIIGRAIMVCG